MANHGVEAQVPFPFFVFSLELDAESDRFRLPRIRKDTHLITNLVGVGINSGLKEDFCGTNSNQLIPLNVNWEPIPDAVCLESYGLVEIPISDKCVTTSEELRPTPMCADTLDLQYMRL